MRKWYALRFPPRGRWTATYSLTGRPCRVRTFPDQEARDAYVGAQQPRTSVLFDGERVAVPATTLLTERGRTVPIAEAVPGI